MVARADITDTEYSFLVSQKILVSHLYDARNQAATAWGDDAKRDGFLFGLSEPCYLSGSSPAHSIWSLHPM